MSDSSAKPGQDADLFELLSPVLLQSALTGKQLDLTQLLTALLAGQVPAAATAPTIYPPPQPPADAINLILPLLIERVIGQTPAGATSAAPAQREEEPTTESTAPAIQKPSVQLSAVGLAVTAILQAIGTIGTPFGMGTEPTTTGTLATLIPILTGAFGASGGFGSLLGFLRSLSAGLAAKPK